MLVVLLVFVVSEEDFEVMCCRNYPAEEAVVCNVLLMCC
jgi:hypothetical protein